MRKINAVLRSLPLSALLWCAILCFCSGPGLAGQYFVAPPPSGDDAHDCSQIMPCRTIQRAIDQVETFTAGSVTIAPGTYSDISVVEGYRQINIHGDCDRPSDVVIDLHKGSLAAFEVKDHAIAWVGCLTIQSEAENDRGLLARRLAILDFLRIRFGTMAKGIHIEVEQGANASCIGPVWIDGSAKAHINVTSMGLLNYGCSVSVAPSLVLEAFVRARSRGIVNAAGVTFSGTGAGTATHGRQRDIEDATLNPPDLVLPGDPESRNATGAAAR